MNKEDGTINLVKPFSLRKEGSLMRFYLEWRLKEPRLPLDYTRIFISFFKSSLKAVDKVAYQELYETGTPLMKPYTFSVYFPNRQVNGSELHFKGNRIKLTFSCSDLEWSIRFLNAFTNQRGETFKLPQQNEMTLIQVRTEVLKPVQEKEVLIKFLSPLAVLKREAETKQNYYLVWNDEGFETQLKDVLNRQLSNLSAHLLLDGFELTPLQPKRLGCRAFGQLILASGGIYRLKGDPKLIQHLWEAGIGSRRSAGFGMFEIIG